MEAKLNYLFELWNRYSVRLTTIDKSRKRQKIALSIVAILFLSLYYVGFDLAEVSFLGTKVTNIRVDKTFFLIPLLITFQFSHYIFTRLNERMIMYRMHAVLTEIESLVEISRDEIFKRNPYISSHGTPYVFSEEDRQYTRGLWMANNILWIPVAFVFILSSITGFKKGLDSGDSGFIAFYTITVIICVITIVYLQVINMIAFRRKHQ